MPRSDMRRRRADEFCRRVGLVGVGEGFPGKTGGVTPSKVATVKGRPGVAAKKPTGPLYHLSHGQRGPVGSWFALSPRANSPPLSKAQTNAAFSGAVPRRMTLVLL